ncbi:ribbon-helix-helix domain-containing protein [Gloeobacter violaceus]|uniref:Gsl0845 protein n=1 Tax=Gloeobacter violaceus (strain ATCC 29082 / PCC 7421) TaxID=251221 RepID=Q7NMC1_GLOVI|nr:ribbon-helix-helix domain-containing protein [Gloeobacter violaceus]BAC88786.1 gsl0845 [Gloeobacter violaceus PCC 7421]
MVFVLRARITYQYVIKISEGVVHFNIYVDDQTGEQLKRVAGQTGLTRNALIRQALREWLATRDQPRWPDIVMEFKGVEDLPTFESYRDELLPPRQDPLA